MKARSRAVAPAEITVASLEAKFEAYLEIMKTRDMSRLMLELRKEISWKCAPKASVLAQYAPLFSGLADLSPGGVLPPKKTAMALLAAHRRKQINFSGQLDNDWTDDVGSTIRATFAKYRDLAASTDATRRCFAKASVQERVAIQGVLSKMGSRTMADESGLPPNLAFMDRMGFGSLLDCTEQDVVDFDAWGHIFTKISNDVDHMEQTATPRSMEQTDTPRSMEQTDTPRSTASFAFCTHKIVSADGSSEADLEAQLLSLANCAAPLPPKAGGQKLIAVRAKIQARADKAAGKGTAKAPGRSKVMKRPAAAAAAEDSQFDTPPKKHPTARKAGFEAAFDTPLKKPPTAPTARKEIKKLHSKAYHTVRREVPSGQEFFSVHGGLHKDHGQSLEGRTEGDPGVAGDHQVQVLWCSRCRWSPKGCSDSKNVRGCRNTLFTGKRGQL